MSVNLLYAVCPAYLPSFVHDALFMRGTPGHTRITATAEIPIRGCSSVTAGEKAEARIEQAEGKTKESLGSVAGNDRLAAEGQAEKSTSDSCGAKEKVKDAVEH
jgi:uncharacterized protein YjbJ (UPF0337 family)